MSNGRKRYLLDYSYSNLYNQLKHVPKNKNGYYEFRPDFTKKFVKYDLRSIMLTMLENYISLLEEHSERLGKSPKYLDGVIAVFESLKDGETYDEEIIKAETLANDFDFFNQTFKELNNEMEELHNSKKFYKFFMCIRNWKPNYIGGDITVNISYGLYKGDVFTVFNEQKPKKPTYENVNGCNFDPTLTALSIFQTPSFQWGSYTQLEEYLSNSKNNPLRTLATLINPKGERFYPCVISDGTYYNRQWNFKGSSESYDRARLIPNSGVGLLGQYDFVAENDGGTLNELPYSRSNIVCSMLSLFTPSKKEDPEEKDPYDPNGNGSQSGGGSIIPNPPIRIDEVKSVEPPKINTALSHMVTIFKPTIEEIKQFNLFLWSPNLQQLFSKMFTNPLDGVISLHTIPVNPETTSKKEIILGNVSSKINSNVIENPYINKTCFIDLSKNENKTGSYMDFEPYTKMQIYLPYIGFRALKTDEVQNRKIKIDYLIDVTTGATTATLYAKVPEQGYINLATYSGNCSNSIPLNNRDYSNQISSMLQSATMIGVAAYSGGSSAIAGAAVSTAESVVNSKPTIQRSGNISGDTGSISTKQPYLLITRPNLCVPKTQKVTEGYPSFITAKLGDLNGFTSVHEIKLQMSRPTEEEKKEIKMLMKGGIYL